MPAGAGQLTTAYFAENDSRENCFTRLFSVEVDEQYRLTDSSTVVGADTHFFQEKVSFFAKPVRRFSTWRFGGGIMTKEGGASHGESFADFVLQHVRVATIEGGEAGVLVLRSDQLIAILTQVDEEMYSTKGKWFLETGFGRLSGCHRIFQSLEEAKAWIAGHFSFKESLFGAMAAGESVLL